MTARIMMGMAFVMTKIVPLGIVPYLNKLGLLATIMTLVPKTIKFKQTAVLAKVRPLVVTVQPLKLAENLL